MTHKTNARLAGFTFLFYIANGIAGMILFTKSVQISILLALLTCFSALVLAVTLHAITRDVDPDLALFGFSCRLIEAVLNLLVVISALGLLWLNARVDAELLSKLRLWGILTSAIFFAAGSAMFSYLLLRGRIVPTALSWLGLIASVLIVIFLPLQLIGFITGPAFQLVWLPMLVFELTFALWLIIKGVNVRNAQGVHGVS